MQTFTKEQALEEMKKGERVQHIDWKEEEEGRGRFWYYRLNKRGKIVDQDGDIVEDWDEFVDGISCWHYCLDFDCMLENENASEYLASLGFNQEQITEIFNGRKPKLSINEDKLKESCRLAAIGFFHADYPNNKSTDKLWEMASKGKLQVCESYENFGTASLIEEMQSLERLMLSEIKQALSSVGEIKNETPLKYGCKKDHLLAHNISKEAIDVISNFADWKPSTRSLFSGYTGSIFAHETIKMLSKQDFYLANDCPSDDVLRELAELAEEMFVNGCDTVYA